MVNPQVGFQPRTTPAERRADIDLRRKLAVSAGILVDDVANLPTGFVNRVTKSTTEGGYNTTEFGITGLINFTVPASTRYTKVGWGLDFSAVVQPASASWYTVRLRAGSGTGGTVIDQWIFPWAVSQQSFGGGSLACTGESRAHNFSGGGATLTMQAGSSTLSFTISTFSYVEIVDMGAV